MAEKLIEGVQPIQQFMEEGSFLMPEIPATLRALQVIGAPEDVDYDYLLSVSGMAVRLVWQQGWAEYEGLPNQGVFYSADGKDAVETALIRAGAAYTLKKVAEVGMEKAKADMRASIDRGVPVLTGHPTVAILGYSGEDFFGITTLGNQDKRIPPHGYNRIEDCDNGMEEYILIHDYKPKAMDGALFLDTLKTAVYYARTTRIEGLGDTALGVSAFDAVAELMVWDEGFEPLAAGKIYDGPLSFPYERPEGYYRTDGARTLAKRFWAGYCDFLCMLNGYSNFSRFLEKYAHLLPEQSGRIKEAAAYYSRACDYSGELWKYVKPNDAGVKKFKKQEVRYAFAAHMLRAKIYTIKAVEILEEIIK